MTPSVSLTEHSLHPTGRSPTHQPAVIGCRPLRLAYIVHGFDIGGIERCVARLVNHLDPQHFEPTIICLTRSGRAAEWVTREHVPIYELHKAPRQDWSVIRRLSRLLQDLQIDIVHSHNWGTLIETTLARRWAGVPAHVHTEHGQGLHEGLSGLKRWLRATARRWAFGQLDQLVVCARSVATLIHAQCAYPIDRMCFIPNGVELPASPLAATKAQMRESLSIPPQAFVLGSVGRLVAVKNYALAVQLLARLVARGLDAHLVIVGNGPEEPRLRALIDDLAVQHRVHLVGRHDNVAPWLHLFDVYLNTSHSEAMSLGILEAMAAGRPLLLSDVGDNRDLARGDLPCGLVAAAGDLESFDQAACLLHDTPALREEFSQHARTRYLRDFSLEIMGSQHQRLYHQVLAQRQESPRRVRSPRN